MHLAIRPLLACTLFSMCFHTTLAQTEKPKVSTPPISNPVPKKGSAPSLLPPEKGIGIFVYNPAPQTAPPAPVSINPADYVSRYPAQATSYPNIPNYYVYLGGLCTLYYETSGWQVHCITDSKGASSSTNIQNISQLVSTYYANWFKNDNNQSITKVLIGVEFDPSSICQINQASSSSDASLTAAAALMSQYAAASNIHGLMFDLEGGTTIPSSGSINCATDAGKPGKNIRIVSPQGEFFLEATSNAMPPSTYLTVFSSVSLTPGQSSSTPCSANNNKCLNLWPALNRAVPNCNNVSCQQGFWIYSLYDQTETEYAINGNDVTFNSSIHDFPYLMKNLANKANWLETQAPNGYYQVAMPASGSGYNAAAYLSFNTNIAEAQALVQTLDYWGDPNSQPTSPSQIVAPSTQLYPATANFPAYLFLWQTESGVPANPIPMGYIQSQYLCVSLSAMTYIYGGDNARQRLPAGQSICGGLNSFVNPATMPSSFMQTNNSQIVGPAVYQINTRGYVALKCAQLGTGNCKLVSYPESILNETWLMLLNWANSWYAPSSHFDPSYPVLPAIDQTP